MVEQGNAQATTVSTIMLQGYAPYALRWLVDSFGMTPGHIDHNFTPGATADLVLFLGDDWAANNPLP